MRLIKMTMFAALLAGHLAQAQTKGYPTVGDRCPDFTLSGVQGYGKDFLGKKWMILDFWSSTCRACLTSFPKVNELQQEFRNDIQFVLVGNNGSEYNKGIEALYERFSKKEKLALTHAFDSTLKDSFYFRTIPHLVIVDKEGVIYGMVYTSDLTSEKLRALVDGRKPTFNLKAD